MTTLRSLVTIVAMVLALTAASAAQSIPLRYEVSGTVEFADEGNAFGLAAGDSIFGRVTAEATGIGDELLIPADGLSVVFHVGAISFSTEQDASFPDFPTLLLTDANIAFLDFFAIDEFFNLFLTSGLFPSWLAVDGGGLGAFGGELTAMRVAEPGTLGLLACGLLALALARRRARSRRAT